MRSRFGLEMEFYSVILRQTNFFVRLLFTFPTSSELANYFEIFVREPTTESDFGVYEVQLRLLDPNTQTPVRNGGQIDFAVIQTGELLIAESIVHYGTSNRYYYTYM